MQFLTGGYSPRAKRKLSADSVKFRSRRYSPDERRKMLFQSILPLVFAEGIFISHPEKRRIVMDQKILKYLVRVCVISMLSAIAFVLMLLEFPVAPIPAAAHLKMDLSDIPALFGAIVYGPVAGVVIELIKNLLELLIKGFGTQMGFGNLMNFIVGCAFVVPFSAIYRSFKKKEKETKGIVAGSVIGFLAIVLIGLGTNYVVAPLFFKHFLGISFDDATLWAAIGTATIVNAVKGLMLSIVSVPLIKGIVTRVKRIS